MKPNIIHINGEAYIESNWVKSILGDGSYRRKCQNANRQLAISNGVFPEFHSIKNEKRTSPSDSKKLFLLRTLPTNLQEKLVDVFKDTEKAIANKEIEPNDELGIMEKLTGDMIDLTGESLGEKAKIYINENYDRFISHYFKAGKLTTERVEYYSRLAAFVEYLAKRQETIAIKYNENTRAYRRWYRQFQASLLFYLNEDNEYNFNIPKSNRLPAWLDNLFTFWSKNKNIKDFVEVKNAKNNNAFRFTIEQQKIAEGMYINANLTVRDIYEKLKVLGEERGWWRTKADKYKPISYSKVNDHFKKKKGQLSSGRLGKPHYLNNELPNIDRDWSDVMKNEIWGIDGTPHDEKVTLKIKGKFKKLQAVYMVAVYDYATRRNLSVATAKQGLNGRKQTESFEVVLEALKAAIKETGYKPKFLQSDNGPASKQLKKWCEDNGIIFFHSKVGKGRDKIVESLFRQRGNAINRHLPHWSGQNRTATSSNSIPSERNGKAQEMPPRLYDQVCDWVKNAGVRLWNNYIIEELSHQKINKTPNELWQEKGSKTAKLTEYELAKILAIQRHEKKLTRSGLTLQQSYNKYFFFPPTQTTEDYDNIIELYERMQSPKNRNLVAYVLSYDEPIYVFDAKEERFLGKWPRKHLARPVPANGEMPEELINLFGMHKYMTKDSEQKVKEASETFFNDERVQQITREPITTGRYRPSEKPKEEIAKAKPTEIQKRKFAKIYSKWDKEARNQEEVLEKGIEEVSATEAIKEFENQAVEKEENNNFEQEMSKLLSQRF